MNRVTDDRVGTIPVRAAHAFDVESLRGYLAGQMATPAGPLQVSQFRGGQSNPTYLLEWDTQRYVLRRKPPGKLLASAHAVDREYRVMRALRASAVPVPETYCYCADESVIGTAFFVMEYIDGRVFWDADLPGVTASERGAIYDELNRVIAAMHSIEPASAGLADFGKPGDYVRRQLTRWTAQYRASETERIEAMENLIAWLSGHVPPEESACVTHGDYRLDNVIFDRNSTRIRAVIDWELATLGSPCADFAYHCMKWHLPPQVRGGLLGLDLAALGIPAEADYVHRYGERTGRPAFANFDYYVAFGFFRLAAILQGVAARALAGNASNAKAQEAGRLARPIAEGGWALAERAQQGIALNV